MAKDGRMNSILVRLGSHWCSRLGEAVIVEEAWCYICGYPEDDAVLRKCEGGRG